MLELGPQLTFGSLALTVGGLGVSTIALPSPHCN